MPSGSHPQVVPSSCTFAADPGRPRGRCGVEIGSAEGRGSDPLATAALAAGAEPGGQEIEAPPGHDRLPARVPALLAGLVERRGGRPGLTAPVAGQLVLPARNGLYHG